MRLSLREREGESLADIVGAIAQDDVRARRATKQALLHRQASSRVPSSSSLLT
jgi:hypothetical protein